MNATEPEPTYRLELTLRKPWLGWYPRPTVVFNGRGQPAQWGTGTWKIPADRQSTIRVFLYNRLWKFGHAEALLCPGEPTVFVYRAPWLPFLPGTLKSLG